MRTDALFLTRYPAHAMFHCQAMSVSDQVNVWTYSRILDWSSKQHIFRITQQKQMLKVPCIHNFELLLV